MTVTELLARIIGAYPGATTDAMKAFGPVFHARLRRHEGDPLAEAATEVLGSFKPTTRQPFPVPVDFEKHLPDARLHLPETSGPAIDLAGHHTRKQQLVADWQQRQGDGIAAKRGKLVAASCRYAVSLRADLEAWKPEPIRIKLTAEEIQLAEDRVVSSERIAAHGAGALRAEDPTMWQTQTDAVREAVRRGESPAKKARAEVDGAAAISQSPAMTRRLADLSRARRTGKPVPEHVDEPLGDEHAEEAA